MPLPHLLPPTLRHGEALLDGRPGEKGSHVEFIAPRHINADIRPIATESAQTFPPPLLKEMAGPDFLPPEDGACQADRILP